MINVEEFLHLSQKFNIIPLTKEIIADRETPVTLYEKLKGENDHYSFLLESTVQDRFSFIGLRPDRVFKYKQGEMGVYDRAGEQIRSVKTELKPFVNNMWCDLKPYREDDLPPFTGGLIGYFSYEMIEEWEDIYHDQSGKFIMRAETPDTILVNVNDLIVFDHLYNKIKIISNVKLSGGLENRRKVKLYQEGKKKVEGIIKKITGNYSKLPEFKAGINGELKGLSGKEKYMGMVERAKEYIKAGDIFQVVLSQKFMARIEIDPFLVYRALRVSNPSPYLFFLDFPEMRVIGSSPEVLVKVTGDKVLTRPLAGTRPRGKEKGEDLALARELKTDEKERAEHIMLVDLGRNDLGRVCEYNSIQVTELLDIEYFPGVMHLVSQVEGQKKKGLSSLDVLGSIFPAGTVSGAPKIRAIEIIDELEDRARGPYAGAVGYLDYSGNLDTCITIRTFFLEENRLSLQVGAGIVADSNPEKEYEETLNKAHSLFQALKILRKEEPYGFSH